MGFKITFKEEEVKENNGIIKEGNYEATIISAESNEWQGTYSIKFNVEIRSDVDQAYQGSKILFNTIYVSPGMPEYEEKRKQKLATFLKACGQFANKDIDLDDLCSDIIGKNINVYVNHRTDKEDKKWAQVAFVTSSKVKNNNNNNNDKNEYKSVNNIQIPDEDLPF